MCGFAGVSSLNKEVVEEMSQPLRRRAIDSENYFLRDTLSLYHAHFRITDLNKNTSQPFISNGIVVSFVGEIYNTQEIQEEFGFPIGLTELETITLIYRKIGERFVEKLNGEFAIFIFDEKIQSYFLYRDYWGTKSIFYTIKDGNLFFSSNLHSFPIKYSVDKKSYTELSTFLFVEPPFTLYENILSLPPCHFIKFRRGKPLQIEKYKISSSYSKGDFFQTLEKSVIRRIPKDHPKISLSLSGGFDSNTIFYYLRKHYKGEILTYSFLTDKNHEDVQVASENAFRNRVQHIIVDTSNKNLVDIDKIVNINGVDHLDIFGILKKNFSEFSDIRIDFGGDCREEILLANTYNMQKIHSFYSTFREKGYIREKKFLDDTFLNYNTLNYNLQIIEELTYPNGMERRMAFTDQSLVYFLDKHLIDKEKYKNYLVEFFERNGIKTVGNRKYGFCDGNNFAPNISLKKI